MVFKIYKNIFTGDENILVFFHGGLKIFYRIFFLLGGGK